VLADQVERARDDGAGVVAAPRERELDGDVGIRQRPIHGAVDREVGDGGRDE
jgi:hypothetical protein